MSDEQELRRTLGHFATGVTVVTAMHDGEPHGLTVNAFTSLSLEPPQLVICLKRGNRSFAAFRDAKRFAVNVLSEGQVDLSRLFASTAERKFDGVKYSTGTLCGSPILAGAHAWLECETVSRLDVPGTHSIFIGRLLGHGHADVAPLIFHRGRYLRLGTEPSAAD